MTGHRASPTPIATLLLAVALWVSLAATPGLAQPSLEMRARIKAMYARAAADIAAGRYASAQSRLQAALATAEPALGPDDPQTLELRNDLAVAAFGLGQSEQAEHALSALVATQRRLQGGGHPDTLLAMDNQAAVLAALGRTSQAAALYRQVWIGRSTALGDADRKSMASGLSLAACLCELSRCDEAALIERQVLATAVRADGERAPMAILAATRLSISLWRQGLYDEGDDLILTTSTRAHGALAQDDPINLELAAAIGEGLKRLGSEESLELLQRIEARETRVNMLGDVRRLDAMYAVAAALLDRDRALKARDKLLHIQSLLAGQTARRGDVLSLAITTEVTLGVAEARLGRPRQAYEAYTRADALVRRRYGDRRASGDGETARRGLVAAQDVFLRRVSAGWVLAH